MPCKEEEDRRSNLRLEPKRNQKMTNIVQMRGEAKLAWIIPSAADIIKNVKTKKINIWRWELIEPTYNDCID